MCLVSGYGIPSKHNVTNGVDGIQENVNLKEDMYGTKFINLPGIWSNLQEDKVYKYLIWSD